MIEVPAKCKFCGRSLMLEVDEDYAKLGDPYKLLGLAACDRCADHRVTERGLREQIMKACLGVRSVLHPSKELLEKSRASLETLTKRYVRVVSEAVSLPELAWEEQIVEALIEQPALCLQTLRRIWQTAREQAKGVSLIQSESSLPPTDRSQ